MFDKYVAKLSFITTSSIGWPISISVLISVSNLQSQCFVHFLKYTSFGNFHILAVNIIDMGCILCGKAKVLKFGDMLGAFCNLGI